MNVKTASCDLLMYILAFALEQSREAGNGGQLIREDISDRTNTYLAIGLVCILWNYTIFADEQAKTFTFLWK